MLRLIAFLAATTAATSAYAQSGIAPASPPPSPADCVRNDIVVCAYRIINQDDLSAQGSTVLSPPAGLPRIDRVEVRRVDGDCLVIVEYFAPDPALQGVAL